MTDRRDQAYREGMLEERERCAASLRHEAAKGARYALACELALETDLTVEQAVKVLRSAPEQVIKATAAQAGQLTAFERTMRGLRNPVVGPDHDDGPDDDVNALFHRARERDGRSPSE
jgi:hypothetical protein